jgi:phosphoribosyl 1,2-cyclic phosphodiesterase
MLPASLVTRRLHDIGPYTTTLFNPLALKCVDPVQTAKSVLKNQEKQASMELIFLGTRGEIKLRSRRHWRHSSLLVRQGNNRLMVDCGADWLDGFDSIKPTAILLTHAHPDHAGGLAKGAPCPVYAMDETLHLLHRCPIRERRVISEGRTLEIGGVSFCAFRVDHSLRAPAVGFRMSVKRSSFFYLPDVADFPDATAALHGTTLYIGDGATFHRSMVRWRNGTPIGHASIATQLSWCERAGVPQAVFTHCGSPIVRGDTRMVSRTMHALGLEYGIDARIASDGDRVVLPDMPQGRLQIISARKQ